jgi:LacI family transcriptional regulator
MGVNIKDVSEAAGVSIKTVSRVINNERYVRPATRDRVEQAMTALGFRPSAAARALAGGRSFQIALMCSNPGPYYLHGLIAGLRGPCSDQGVRLIVHAYDLGSSELDADVRTMIRQLGPDGVILTPPIADHEPVLDALEQAGTPYVRISPGVQVDRSPAVSIDNEAAAREMTRALLQLGHRRIGFIVGHRAYAVSNQRLAGYLDALREAGVALDLELVQQGWFDFASGEQGADRLLSLPEPPTAIFAASDDMAAGVLACAHRRGLRVPDDLSIAGFDDTDLARLLWPPLATVRQPIKEMATEAAGLLFGRADPGLHVMAHELVMRESTAKA